MNQLLLIFFIKLHQKEIRVEKDESEVTFSKYFFGSLFYTKDRFLKKVFSLMVSAIVQYVNKYHA